MTDPTSIPDTPSTPAADKKPAAEKKTAPEKKTAADKKKVRPAAKKEVKSEAVATAPEAAERPAPPHGQWWWGTGRRKSAVARVRIRPGEGTLIINKRSYEEYFTEERDRNDLVNVLNKTKTEGQLEIHVNVHGGGYTGQAGAIVLGLGRALRGYDQTLEPILRENAFLTRDPRKVERKKYGQPGARKRFQFSKR